MTAITTDDGAGSAHRDGPYSGLPNKLVQAANGVGYAYRDTGGEGGVPLVLLQHFRGNRDDYFTPRVPEQDGERRNGVDYAFRELGDSAVPLVLLQHFRGNLDYWDPTGG